MSQKIYLTILRWGIYFSLLSVLLVFKNLYFPYITSKQIYFNILIEVLAVFWLAFIIKYPEWRPKWSWISIGLISYFAVILLSSFFSVDFNLSFWGDIERMLGFFHLLHFLIFYFIIITVMRTWADWRNLFLASIVVAILVSFYGIAQRLEIIKSPWGSDRIIATIGNAAYVGAYAIFNIYFTFILFLKEKNWGRRSLYLIAFFIILLALIFSGTRGAYLGFGISILIMLPLAAILNKNKKIRKYSLISFSILFVLVIVLFSNTDSNFVRKNSFLSRMTHISLKDVTMQTRFISWKAAAKDFKNHPILGTGHGNYAITFDKYFDPTFYNYTRSETYFDRAHNNLVDIVSTTGLLGILTYFSIFIAAGYYLIRGFKKGSINSNDFILLVGLIIAYFIQNLVVFDALVTYIALMVMLSYIYWLGQSGIRELDKEEERAVEEKDRKLENKEIYALFGVGIIMLIIIYQFNVKPLRMIKGTIDGQMALAQQDIVKAVEEYKKALSYRTVLDRDSRDSLVRAIPSNYSLLNRIDKQRAQEILDYVIELGKTNIAYNPKDNMMQLELAQVLDTAARFNSDNNDKFYYYSDQALEAVNRAIESSPGRVPVYFSKAQIYLTRGEKEKAIEVLKYAASLNEDYYDSFCHLGKVYFISGQEDEGYKEMDKCIDKGGVVLIKSVDFIKNLINHYVEKDDTAKTLKLYERFSRLETNNAKILINLAKLYAQVGRNEEAAVAARKAVELDRSLEAAVEDFIRRLE